MRLWLGLALLTGPLAAQSVRVRLEGRVPAAALATVDSLVQQARQEDLPTEPLVQKALEGGAKHVSAGRIVAAVQLRLVQMRDARTLLVRAGHGPFTAAEVMAVSGTLKRGVPGPVVERLVVALPNESRGSALHAEADLVAHGFDPDSSAGLLVEATRRSLRGGRLLDVSAAVLHALQRGHTRPEALALVRLQLPNVPPAPKPPKASVAGARRPGASSGAAQQP